MSRLAIPVICLLLCAVPALAWQADKKAAPAAADAKVEFKTVRDRASYSIGVTIGQNIAKQGIELDGQFVAAGIMDVLAERDPQLTPKEMQAAMDQYRQDMEAARMAQAEKNKEAGIAFLAENKKRKGVVTTKSGLQYEVMKEGTGATPKATDRVKTHYHGTLIDGTVFDSSVERDEPFVLGVNQVIRGWSEALQLMKVGSKWKLYVPSELAYGPDGAGGAIGPNTPLIFEVELLSIEAPRLQVE